MEEIRQIEKLRGSIVSIDNSMVACYGAYAHLTDEQCQKIKDAAIQALMKPDLPNGDIGMSENEARNDVKHAFVDHMLTEILGYGMTNESDQRIAKMLGFDPANGNPV